MLFSKDKNKRQIDSKIANHSITTTANDTIIPTYLGNYAHEQKNNPPIGLKQKQIYRSSGRLLDVNHNPKYSYNKVDLWNKSSATLRSSSPQITFSREQRFRQSKQTNRNFQYPQTSSTLNKKSCSFGKGRKFAINPIILKNANQIPSPDRYDLQEYHGFEKNKGKTFGINWSSYSKTYLTHRKDSYNEHFTQRYPTAIYNIRQIIGKDKKKYTIQPKLKMCIQQDIQSKKYIPGPYYEINENLIKISKGLNQRNFGFGYRLDLSKPLNDNPSPAQYQIPRCFQNKNY